MTADPTVRAYALFIASIGSEAQEILREIR